MNITKDHVKYIISKHLASSSFRRKGPGVTANLRFALHSMNQEQREVALAQGYDKGQLYRGKESGKLGVQRG